MENIKPKGTLKKEVARDILAFGSWIFYILVFARAMVEPYRPFVDQIIVAALVLITASFFIKEHDDYISKGLILTVFTSLFYKSAIFTFFASAVFIALIFSAYYLGSDKKGILKGIVIGILSSLVAYILTVII